MRFIQRPPIHVVIILVWMCTMKFLLIFRSSNELDNAGHMIVATINDIRNTTKVATQSRKVNIIQQAANFKLTGRYSSLCKWN